MKTTTETGDRGDADEPLLDGLRVIEVATILAAPTVGAILAEYGADVIHIEEPTRGDPLRSFVSQTVRPTASDSEFNVSWELINRNKRSLALSLKTPEGQQIVRRLLKDADVFITNSLPDVQQRLSIDYASVRGLNPRIIHVFVNGWGSEGPLRDVASYDFTAYWAASGMMAMMTPPGGEPAMMRPGMGDRPTGMTATAALGLALYHRERTGKGQAIEVSLMHSAMFTLASDIQRAAIYGSPLPTHARAHAASALLNSYATADGRWLLLNVLVRISGDPERWSAFCSCIGAPLLADDPRFSTPAGRNVHNDELIHLLDAAFARGTLAEWAERLNAAKMPSAPVLEPQEAASHAQSVANDFFIDAEHSVLGPYKALAFPFRFSSSRPQIRRQAPGHGDHTQEILAELGFDADGIAELASRGVVSYPER